MRKIWILDVICNKAYDPLIAVTESLGGTERTVTRIAEALGEEYDVRVYQHCRTTASEGFKAKYLPLSHLSTKEKPDAFISLRNTSNLIRFSQYFPDTKMILWLHDLGNPVVLRDMDVIAKLGVTVLCVSEFHKTDVTSYINSNFGHLQGMKIKVMHNPIADDLMPDNTPIQPNKLMFFSSPHKGLEQTLRIFQSVHYRHPDMMLYISNPGYLNSITTDLPNVKVLGTLAYPDVIKNVRESFVVFYPNYTFPETFGLVFAEANAVGTPVIAHPFGAAPEVLSSKEQLVDCRSIRNIVDRLELWMREGRPNVSARPEFRLTEVIKKWKALLKL